MGNRIQKKRIKEKNIDYIDTLKQTKGNIQLKSNYHDM